MKLTTFSNFFNLSVVAATILDIRQQCSEDDCYRSVWGNGGLVRIVRAAQDCEDYLTTSVIWNPMYVTPPEIYATRTDGLFQHHSHSHYKDYLDYDDAMSSHRGAHHDKNRGVFYYGGGEQTCDPSSSTDGLVYDN